MKDRNALTEQDLEDRLRRERREDIEIIGRDLILRSPNGTRFRIVIDNYGDLSGEIIP